MNSRASPSQAARTGSSRACVNCVRAKVKCVFLNTACERCSRLGRQCQPSPAVRKRTANKEPKTAAKVARLEEKLDSLVSLIRSTPQVQLSKTVDPAGAIANPASPEALLPTPTASTPQTADNTGSVASLQTPSYAGPHDAAAPLVPNDPCHKSLASADSHSTLPGFHSGCLSPDEANEALYTFRTHMLRHLPILAIPTSMHSLELKAQRPFLWLCIMAVSMKSSAKQRTLGLEIRRKMAYRIILEGERNIDLLLGLLVYAGWSQYYVFSKPIITNVIQLATALLADLGLNKFALRDPFGLMLDYDTRGCPKPVYSANRTVEERRTALACFAISNFISIHWQRADPLNWTPYLEECIRVLLETEECPGDKHLVYIIRLQLIVEKTSAAPWANENPNDQDLPKAPAMSYINALSRDLTAFKASIPGDLQQKETLTLYAHRATLVIHEVALSSYPLTPGNSDLQRLDYLWICLQAIKDWFEIFLQFPPSSYIGLPMFIYSSLAHCATALGRLATLEQPGWDLNLVRETCDLQAVLTKAINNFHQVKTAVGLDPETQEDVSMFSAAARRTTAIKHWSEVRLANAEVSQQQDLTANDLLSETLLDFADDTWLREYFGNEDMRIETV